MSNGFVLLREAVEVDLTGYATVASLESVKSNLRYGVAFWSVLEDSET